MLLLLITQRLPRQTSRFAHAEKQKSVQLLWPQTFLLLHKMKVISLLFNVPPWAAEAPEYIRKWKIKKETQTAVGTCTNWCHQVTKCELGFNCGFNLYSMAPCQHLQKMWCVVWFWGQDLKETGAKKRWLHADYKSSRRQKDLKCKHQFGSKIWHCFTSILIQWKTEQCEWEDTEFSKNDLKYQ